MILIFIRSTSHSIGGSLAILLSILLANDRGGKCALESLITLHATEAYMFISLVVRLLLHQLVLW